jgi:lysophospholipase L1-like esterase
MNKGRIQIATLALLATSLAPVVTPAAGASRPAAWREAFTSSPGSPAGMTDVMFARLMEQLKLPADVVAVMKASRVTGTIRYRIRVAVAGSKVQIRFSNEEATANLLLSGASVALASNDFDAVKGSMKVLKFGGNSSAMIPAGAPILSDPIDLTVAHGSDLLITVSTPDQVQLEPAMGGPLVVAAGNQTGEDTLRDSRRMSGRPLVTGVNVFAADPPHVIVALGDSITDGVRSGPDGLHSWPEQLDRRLASRTSGGRYSVVNAGIGGNRLLNSGWGVSALARMDRDALRIEGITHLIVLEGTNDLGMSGKSLFGENAPVSFADLVAGYRQVIARAHQRGAKVILGTITPRTGSIDFDAGKEKVRSAVNAWIRLSNEADGFIDFDRLVRDPDSPQKLSANFDSGDHLHPSDAGNKAMGDGIDLSLFD